MRLRSSLRSGGSAGRSCSPSRRASLHRSCSRAPGTLGPTIPPASRPPIRRYEPGHPDADAEGFVAYPKWRLILTVVSLGTVLALFLLLQFTRFGLVVRAGMREPEMLRFLGVNIQRRFAIVFGLGAAIAGIAGIFGGPVSSVYPGLGMAYLVPSFLVVVIGGMGSVPGAVIAAILLGMALSFSAEYSALQQLSVYLVAVVVLLLRPRGLLGQKGVLE